MNTQADFSKLTDDELLSLKGEMAYEAQMLAAEGITTSPEGLVEQQKILDEITRRGLTANATDSI